MNQKPSTQATGRGRFETLELATRRYRLHNPNITNVEIAGYLGLKHYFQGDSFGSPDCCFFQDGDLVAIRTKRDEMAIFHVRQRIQQQMEIFGDRILS